MLRTCDLLNGHGHNPPDGQSRHRGPLHRDGERDTQRGEVTYLRLKRMEELEQESKPSILWQVLSFILFFSFLLWKKINDFSERNVSIPWILLKKMSA